MINEGPINGFEINGQTEAWHYNMFPSAVALAFVLFNPDVQNSMNITDEFGMQDGGTPLWRFPETVPDIFALQEVLVSEHISTLFEQLGIDDSLLTDAIFPLFENLGINTVINNLIVGQEVVSVIVGIQQTFDFFIELALSDQIGIAETPADILRNTLAIADGLAISGVASSRLVALNLLADILGIIETLDRNLYASVLDQLGVSEDVVNLLKAAGITSEQLGLTDAVSFDAAIYIALDDALAMQDTLTLAQVLQDSLADGISFAVTLLGPGTDTYTGWVMNSENMAVSTYTNYDFTDMARINGQYYGVKQDGVFLLDGTKDDTDFIQSIIRSAKMSFGTSNLKAVDQAYLGFRADGSPVLKLVTDEKEETWYTISESRTDLHTRRVRLAKGQIGRYWQFEIVTTDSTKLELDSVELFPITFKRKV